MLRLPDHPGPPSLRELQSALDSAGEEDARWEAKGTKLDKTAIAKAVAGLANHEGGVLVLGVERTGGTWAVTGMAPLADGEPGRWIADVIADALTPAPRVDPKIVTVDPAGRWAAAVVVDQLTRDLAVTSSGRIHRRDHGRTSVITDGSSLTALVLSRAGVGVPARLDPALPADELADEIVKAARASDLGVLPALLSALRSTVIRAVQFDPDPQPAMDQLTAVAAGLATASDPATLAALRDHHTVFDEGRAIRGPVNARHELDLFAVLRPNVLALGGLLVRLERWDAVRALAVHRGPDLVGARRSWLLYMDHAQEQARQVRNAHLRRHSISAGRDATMRLRALRPDLANEHRALDSILTFDAIANLIELAEADRLRYDGQVWPDFALFDPSAVRPIVERVLTDTAVRADLLPGWDAPRAGELLVDLDTGARKSAPDGTPWAGVFSQEAERQLRRLGVVRR